MLDEVFSNFATNLRWYQQYLERNAYLGHLMGVPPSDIGMFVRKTDERFGKQKKWMSLLTSVPIRLTQLSLKWERANQTNMNIMNE